MCGTRLTPRGNLSLGHVQATRVRPQHGRTARHHTAGQAAQSHRARAHEQRARAQQPGLAQGGGGGPSALLLLRPRGALCRGRPLHLALHCAGGAISTSPCACTVRVSRRARRPLASRLDFCVPPLPSPASRQAVTAAQETRPLTAPASPVPATKSRSIIAKAQLAAPTTSAAGLSQGSKQQSAAKPVVT